ncbi:hypothetical protein LCGC14_0248840 [marine sediment metagenome]|uniref:Uncharacterized protein n=1 Tax=marine sediment metagenome TaxID=412755 RepID=A0A0F9ULK7_9ZZZZ
MEILILFMPYFIEWLMKCQEDRNRDDIEAGLNNPGIREWFAIRAVIKRRKNLKGRDLRMTVRDSFAALKELEPEDVQELMAAVPLLPQS